MKIKEDDLVQFTKKYGRSINLRSKNDLKLIRKIIAGRKKGGRNNNRFINKRFITRGIRR